MNTEERREQLLKRLHEAEQPLTGTKLSREFAVSRQIIVGDISILRAQGVQIFATPRGYILPKEQPEVSRMVTLVCQHDAAGMEKELLAVVDNGGAVLDVIVEHPIYGQITGLIDASSRRDVSDFVGKCKEHPESLPLSALTNGIHLHTILCPTEQAYRNVCTALTRLGFLLDE